MRPKKKILVFSTNEQAGACLSHVLFTRGYHPRLVHTPEDWAEQIDGFAPDVALLLYRGEGKPMMEEAARTAFERDISVCAALVHRRLTWSGLAHSVVTDRGDHSFMMELLETLRTRAAHKRGPKRVGSMGSMRIAATGRHAAELSARLA